MHFELPPHLAEDPNLLRQLVLPLRDAIVETFGQTDWTEFGYGCDLVDEFRGHSRLYRSLSWGDEDYPDRVIWALELVLQRNPGALALIFGHARAGAWLTENRPGAVALWQASAVNARQALDAVERLEGFNVAGHVRRIRASLDNDPEQAIGSTKELLETVMRHILDEHGVPHEGLDIPQLFKAAQQALGLTTDGEPTGSAMRRLGGSMAQLVSALAELRNSAGTGHGRTEPGGLGAADAALIVTAGVGLADWLARRARSTPPPSTPVAPAF